MGTVSTDKKTFPQDAPFDPELAQPVDLGYDFETWAQGPLIWWRMNPEPVGMVETGPQDSYYGAFPKTFRLRNPDNVTEPDGALDIGTLSDEARTRFLALPSTDRHYARDFTGDKAANHIFYPRLWRKDNPVGLNGDDAQFMLCVPRDLAESVITPVDAMARYIYHSLPTPLLWPYLRMSDLPRIVVPDPE